MKIQNKSTKVVGIAGHYLLPDQSIELDDASTGSPVVAKLMEMGILAQDETEAKAEMENRIRKELEEKLRAEAEAKKKAEEEEPSKKQAKAGK